MPPQQPKPEKDPGSVTMFRTANFFVHAFAQRLRTGTLGKASGSETVLERIRWTSAEKQRLMAAQTRLLPQVETVSSTLWHEITIPGWLEGGVVMLVLGVLLFFQAFHLFNYPAYTVEEGNLMANASALLHGNITPYAYSYDHPPIGWLQIAAWLEVTGGVGSFGNAINSGRVLMLVLAGLSSGLLYLITSRLSGSRSTALLAMVIYTLSPLSLLYRREVLLDNIATFWLLLSLCLITTAKSRLRTFILAAVALGIAILSNEIFVIFLPAVLYAVWLYATEFQRKFSLLTFLYVALTVASVYVLLALLKGELFPSSLLPGDKGAHPSLISGIVQQWQGPFSGEQFSEAWHTWGQVDRFFLLAGGVALVINVLGGTVNRFQALSVFFAATFAIFLLIHPLVYPTSILPLLPFIAINIALAINTPLRWLTKRMGFDLVRALLCFTVIGALVMAGIQQAYPLLGSQNTTEPQQQAMLWIRTNVPRNAEIMTNSYLYSDLREPGGMGVGSGKPFAHAHIYSYAALDPRVSDEELKGDWQKIDFLVVDATMLKEIRTGSQYALLNQALHHAIPRVAFGSAQDNTQIQIYQVNKT